MADETPSLLPLSEANRFEAPVYQSHPRSPSSSPTRHGRFAVQELDPLLANLSPISTLEALRASTAISPLPVSKGETLAESIAEASENERALGIRAALASKKLREWVEEVQDWHWPLNKFAPPQVKVQSQDVGKQGSRSAVARSEPAAFSTGSQELYWGSLQARVVQEREARIEHIRNDMATLELAELKGFVQGAHSTSSSRSTSYDMSFSYPQSSHYTHMDDFTVIITATIIQALPFLARLERLLGRWSLRLFILRQVPHFLQQLEDTELALGSAWTTLRQAAEDSTAFEMTREAYTAIKAVLQSRVSELARQIDGILDALEGQNDRIPDRWIDEMEDTETDFQNWIAEAERMVELNEWRIRRKSMGIADDVMEPDRATSPKNDTGPSPPALEGGMQKDPGTENTDTGSLQDTTANQNSRSNGRIHSPQFSEHVSKDSKVSPVDSRTQPGENRTPSRGLFFMRNSPPSSNSPESASPKNYSDLSKQSEAPLPDLVTSENDQKKNESNDRNLLIEGESSQTIRRSAQRKPPPLALDHTEVEPALNSQLSRTTSESSASDAFSDMSSPQIIDASSVQFFKTPMEDKFPPWVTQDDNTPVRNQNQKPAQGFPGHARSISAMEPMTRSRASSHVSDITIMGRDTKDEQKNDGDMQPTSTGSGGKFHRASISAIEEIPRSEVSTW